MIKALVPRDSVRQPVLFPLTDGPARDAVLNTSSPPADTVPFNVLGTIVRISRFRLVKVLELWLWRRAVDYVFG